jgi:hypothetical protein
LLGGYWEGSYHLLLICCCKCYNSMLYHSWSFVIRSMTPCAGKQWRSGGQVRGYSNNGVTKPAGAVHFLFNDFVSPIQLKVPRTDIESLTSSTLISVYIPLVNVFPLNFTNPRRSNQGAHYEKTKTTKT